MNETHNDRISDDLRNKLFTLLTKEALTYNELGQNLLKGREIRDFFTEDLVQECLAFGGRRSPLKKFPPDFSTNLGVEVLKEFHSFAPNVLRLIVNLCVKPNQLIVKNDISKIVFLMSNVLSSLNQIDSAIQKLVGLKLKLYSVTNVGINFLKELGITQSSRSRQMDSEYLAS